MSRWSKVPRAMWQEQSFRELSEAAPCAQLLYLRLLTGPENTALPGLFTAWAAGLAESLRWPLEGFRERFGELFAKGFAEANWDLGIVWLPRAIEINRPDNPNVIKGWRSAWDEIPSCDIKTRAFSRLRSSVSELGPAFAKAFDEGFREPFREGSGNGMPNQEREREREQEREKVAPPALLTVSGARPSASSASSKSSKARKYAAEEIAAHDRLLDAFIAGVKVAKGLSVVRVTHAGDHAAIYALLREYGEAETLRMFATALMDPHVLQSNCTVRYIASKPLSWLGRAPAKASGARARVGQSDGFATLGDTADEQGSP